MLKIGDSVQVIETTLNDFSYVGKVLHKTWDAAPVFGIRGKPDAFILQSFYERSPGYKDEYTGRDWKRTEDKELILVSPRVVRNLPGELPDRYSHCQYRDGHCANPGHIAFEKLFNHPAFPPKLQKFTRICPYEILVEKINKLI